MSRKTFILLLLFCLGVLPGGLCRECRMADANPSRSSWRGRLEA